MTPVHSAVGMDLKVEADAHPAVQSASAATRGHQVILQPNSRGANQLSYKHEQESNIHSSPKQLSLFCSPSMHQLSHVLHFVRLFATEYRWLIARSWSTVEEDIYIANDLTGLRVLGS